MLQEIESIQIDRLQKWIKKQDCDNAIKTQCDEKFSKRKELRKETLIGTLLDFFIDEKYENRSTYINQVKSKNTKLYVVHSNRNDIQRNKYPDEWKTKR
ncbi:MAG: hypothetical protein U5N85_14000 [Arcicella sp.]|nr:hypothetical protein [Arcicella sp.]